MIELNPHEVIGQAIEIHKASFTGDELAPTAMFRHRVGQDVFFTERDGDRLLGYAIVEDRDPFLWLWEIAVDPKFRRQGVAGRLLESIANFAFVGNEGHGIELTVRRDNDAAIQTYMAHNFYTVRVLKRYYKQKDALLMRRDNL